MWVNTFYGSEDNVVFSRYLQISPSEKKQMQKNVKFKQKMYTT